MSETDSSSRFSPAGRGRLTSYDLGRFPSETLFDRIGRAACEAGCLPRKELYEAWEVARRARRLFRGGRVVDMAGGHGLLAAIMLLLDDSSPDAIVVDRAVPPSMALVRDALTAAWPRLAGRVSPMAASIDAVSLARDRRRRVVPCLRRADRSGARVRRPRAGPGLRSCRAATIRPSLIPAA